MKKIFFPMIAFAMLLLGCEKIKEATSYDFTVNNIRFNFAAIAKEATTLSGNPVVTTRAGGTTTSFAVTQTVNLSDLGSADLVKYANKISKVEVNNSTVTVTANPSDNYTITDLKIVADGVSGSIEIPSYTIGDDFTEPAGMKTYTSALIKKLLETGSISVTVTGMSDAPTGTTISISYKSDILFTASLL